MKMDTRYHKHIMGVAVKIKVSSRDIRHLNC